MKNSHKIINFEINRIKRLETISKKYEIERTFLPFEVQQDIFHDWLRAMKDNKDTGQELYKYFGGLI